MCTNCEFAMMSFQFFVYYCNIFDDAVLHFCVTRYIVSVTYTKMLLLKQIGHIRTIRKSS